MSLYTGVGSRTAPHNILEEFKITGNILSLNNFTLRSGHAPGSDLAFEEGCDKYNGDKEIYLPWPKFENSNSKYYDISNEAYSLASKYRNNWDNIKYGSRKLLARDCYQILGLDLKSPSDFVVCWTKYGKPIGGTSMVIRIAEDNNIPIFNYGDSSSSINLKIFLKEKYNINYTSSNF